MCVSMLRIRSQRRRCGESGLASTLFVCFLLLFVAVPSEAEDPYGATISKTLTLGPNSAYTVYPSAFDEQVFMRGRVYPNPAFTVTLFNDTFALNTKGCKDLLLRRSISGPLYGELKGFTVSSVTATVDYLLESSASSILIGQRMWTREQIRTLGLTSGLVVELKGDERFTTIDNSNAFDAMVSEYSSSKTSGGSSSAAVYTFTIPTTCVMSRFPPPHDVRSFTVGPKDREVLGQVMSFFVMIAGVLCALCSLVGALLPLLLLQVFAALTMVSCATPALLAETYFTHYVLFPSRAFLGDLRLYESTLIVIGIVALVVALLELLHYAYERKFDLHERHLASEKHMTEAAESAMRSAALRGVKVRPRDDELLVGDDGEDDGVFAGIISNRNKKKDKDKKKKAKDGAAALEIPLSEFGSDLDGSFASGSGADGMGSPTNGSFAARRRRGAGAVVEETLQSVRDSAVQAAGEAASYLPMCPYVGACVLCMLFVGAVMNCGMIVFSSDSTTAMIGIAVLGLLGMGVGLPMLSIGIWMRKGFVYCVYRVAQGGLPPSMHVTGVWGPNHERLRFGIFCEDFRESRRSVSVVSIVYGFTIAILAGSSPNTRGSCTTVFGIAVIVTFGYGLLTFALWPMRSRLNNYCLLVVNVLTFIYECAMLAFVSQATDAVTPSNNVLVAMVMGTLICVTSIVSAVSHLASAFWEIKGSRAAKYASLHHTEDALDAEMAKLQTELEIEAGVEETLDMYRAAAKEAEDEEGLEAARGGGASASAAGGAKRRRHLLKAKQEALERARRERMSGMRFAHDTVRQGAALAIGDDRHPSYADFLLVDYHMVPEGTRQEFRTAAQVRKDAARNEHSTGVLSTLTFEEQMILQGRSQKHGRHHQRSDYVQTGHNVSNHASAWSTSAASVPHIYSSSIIPSPNARAMKRIVQNQRREELSRSGVHYQSEEEDDML